jgi:hypothetical protein
VFYFLVLCFSKKAFLFKLATQEASLWHFHIYRYNVWIGSFPPLSPFYLSPALMVISTGLNILYSFKC